MYYAMDISVFMSICYNITYNDETVEEVCIRALFHQTHKFNVFYYIQFSEARNCN